MHVSSNHAFRHHTTWMPTKDEDIGKESGYFRLNQYNSNTILTLQN